MSDSLGKSGAEDAAKAGRGAAKRQVGTCVSVDWANHLAVVALPPGGQTSMPFVGVAPVPQRQCLVGFFGPTGPVCLGAITPPVLGVVAGSPSNGLLPVRCDDGVTYQLAYDQRITSWASNARVQVNWDGGGTVLFPLSADPYTHDDLIPDPPSAPSSGKPTSKTITFQPTDSGTQNGSGASGSGAFWTPNVWCGVTTIGAYFYGAQIASSIPDTATITSAEVYISALQTGGSSPTIGLHSLASKAGNIVVDQAVTVPGGTGWKNLLGAGLNVNALKTGARLGIATNHGGGPHVWAPAGQGSGQIKISWRT